ncbi:MAG: hypothetical protein H6813_00025 [Phycisphaeraceae bacterium]|nr:hypothetical protein [Phycisphaeraceae bacterium]MCB9847526.1 hypothetical protein [Phycisphaeraceae bacterium]
MSEHHADHPIVLPLQILPQPDDETCGPTCLHSVYRYWGEDLELKDVIDSAASLKTAGAGRGTLAVMLGIDALTRGYRARLFTFNLHVFDPTWFGEDGRADSQHLIGKLREQADAKCVEDPRFRVASGSYLEYLRLGGVIRFRDLKARLIARFLREGVPILTGLSATYLYRCAREFGPNDDYDDIRGEPCGHFVVLHGYDPQTRRVTVADPLANNPGFEQQRYTVSISRLIAAIMLGVLTYDSNLLVIEPAGRGASGGRTP